MSNITKGRISWKKNETLDGIDMAMSGRWIVICKELSIPIMYFMDPEP
jgi:hypothetical protein